MGTSACGPYSTSELYELQKPFNSGFGFVCFFLMADAGKKGLQSLELFLLLCESLLSH